MAVSELRSEEGDNNFSKLINEAQPHLILKIACIDTQRRTSADL